MSNTNIRPWMQQGPEMPAEFTARVGQLTNWQRSRWVKAGQPGAVTGSVEQLDEFLATLPRRLERHVFSLTKVGDRAITLRQMLAGRTGIVVAAISGREAVVEGTARMIDRLVRRFHYCLVAEIHQPSGE